MNSLFAISPYNYEGFWVFDDPSVGLVKEPFVSGADRIIDILVENLPNAEAGFQLIFSVEPFPGYNARFQWVRPEFGGNWYRWPKQDIEGWLCPALFKYFPTAPGEIYVKVAEKRKA